MSVKGLLRVVGVTRCLFVPPPSPPSSSPLYPSSEVTPKHPSFSSPFPGAQVLTDETYWSPETRRRRQGSRDWTETPLIPSPCHRTSYSQGISSPILRPNEPSVPFPCLNKGQRSLTVGPSSTGKSQSFCDLQFRSLMSGIFRPTCVGGWTGDGDGTGGLTWDGTRRTKGCDSA